jgi:GTPase SAR1 family protein
MEDKIPSSKHKYKLIILGDKGVGITSFINRIHESSKMTKYTHKDSYIAVDFQTSKGEIKFDIWDSSIRSNFNCVRDSY